MIGHVTLARMVAAGAGIGSATDNTSSGCVDAVTDGIVTSSTGRLAFHATGLLCGETSAYTVVTSNGFGSMSGDLLRAEIVNDSVSETWSGEIAPAH